jgi:hypothetical protein
VNSGPFFPGAGTVILTGTADQDLGGTSFYNVLVDKSAGTVTKSASATVGGTFTVAAGTASVELNDQNLLVNGDTTIGTGSAVTSTSGALVFGNAPAADFFLSTGAVSSTSGVILFNSAVVNNLASVIGTDTGSITFNGVVLNSGTVSLGAGTASSTDVFTNEGLGVMNLGTGAVTSTATFTNNGLIHAGSATFEAQAAYLGGGTFEADTSTFKVSGNANRSLNLANAYRFENDIESGGVAVMTRDLDIANTFTGLAGSNTLDADTFTLDFHSLTTLGSGSVVTSTTGTINFAGTTVNYGRIGTESGNLRFTGLLSTLPLGEIHIGSGNASTTLAVSNEGTFYLESGHVTTTADFTNGAGSDFEGGTGTFDLNGTANLIASPMMAAFAGSAASFVLSGDGDQTFPSGLSVGGLRVSKPSGTVTLNGTTVYGPFVTTDAAIVELNANNLYAYGGATIGAGTFVTSTIGLLNFTGGPTQNSGTVTSTSGSITTGGFVNNAGAFLGNNAGDITIGGALTNARARYRYP